jgi:hypothetical protein
MGFPVWKSRMDILQPKGNIIIIIIIKTFFFSQIFISKCCRMESFQKLPFDRPLELTFSAVNL